MTDVIMPQLGESIAEGTIVKWLKKVGDPVRRDEDLLVVSTDKVEAELPSPAAGILQEIRAAEGKTVPIKTVIAVIGDGAPASVPAPETLPQPGDAPSAAPTAAPPPAGEHPGEEEDGRHWFSPLVKKMAREEGISEEELKTLSGTGRNGRVTRQDLEAYVQTRKQGVVRDEGRKIPEPAAPAMPLRPPVARELPAPPPSIPPAARMMDVPGTARVPTPHAAREEVRPMTNLRRVIAENMVKSRQTSAHVQTVWEVDFSRIVKVRDKHKEAFKREEGAGLTFTVFIAAAVARTLRHHPWVNAEVRGGDIVFKKDVNLGIAVDLGEEGLIVPVVFNAQDLNLRGLARAIDDVATRARSKRLKLDEIKGGTFTLTNFGVFGSLMGMPIINQPEVAILGVGAVVKRPVVIETEAGDTLGIKPMALLSLSFDHRIVDGATADRFMKDLKNELESWAVEP